MICTIESDGWERSGLNMPKQNLITDLVTLNILTKYFITIRYNLNKILLS